MSTLTRLSLCVLALLFCAVSFASQSLEFEVATIKPYVRGSSQVQICHAIDSRFPPNFPVDVPLGRCVIQRTTLKGLIASAYPSLGRYLTVEERVTGGPGWADSDLFDVEGKAEDPSTATQEKLRSMLQALVRDRFKLRFHYEPKDIQGFALVLAKGGPKLQPGTGDYSDVNSTFGQGSAKMWATNASMSALAAALGGRVGGPVVDQTGLQGTYAFSIPLAIGGDRDTQAAAIFTTLQEELGLRLEAQKVKAKTETIVIDSAEKPPAP